MYFHYFILKTKEGFYMNEYNNHGINFPDSNDITTKSLLGKWSEKIIIDIKYCLTKIYSNNNINFIKHLFQDTYNKIYVISLVLFDLVENRNLNNIIKSVYSKNSNEYYLFLKFQKLYNNINNWNTNDIYNIKLRKILNL